MSDATKRANEERERSESPFSSSAKWLSQSRNGPIPKVKVSLFNNVLLRVQIICIHFHVCTFLLRSNAFYNPNMYEGEKKGTVIYRDAFIISSLKDCSDVGNILV